MKKTMQFAQIPMLELDDGTKMVQSRAIYGYIAEKYKLRPADPDQDYKGQCAACLFWDDYFEKYIHWSQFAKEGRDKLMDELVTQHTPEYLRKLATCLPDGQKFLCGDEVTIYDIQVAGFIINLMTNPKSLDPEKWAKMWETSPDRVKKYVSDFEAEFKEYLEKRPSYFL